MECRGGLAPVLPLGVSPPLLLHPEGGDPPRSSKRSEVPLKREGEGLEVLLFSLLLFPSSPSSPFLQDGEARR
jgi:hypothetical protein